MIFDLILHHLIAKCLKPELPCHLKLLCNPTYQARMLVDSDPVYRVQRIHSVLMQHNSRLGWLNIDWEVYIQSYSILT